jgi:hypothetical protein
VLADGSIETIVARKMKRYNKSPVAVSLLTPEQDRVTQEDGTDFTTQGGGR